TSKRCQSQSTCLVPRQICWFFFNLFSGNGDFFSKCSIVGHSENSKVFRRCDALFVPVKSRIKDRKSTRLNSSHVSISYAVFCLLPSPPPSTLFPYTTLFRS